MKRKGGSKVMSQVLVALISSFYLLRLLDWPRRIFDAVIIIYYSWNDGRAEAVCAGEKE